MLSHVSPGSCKLPIFYVCFFLKVQHLRRELYRAQSQGCLVSEENEVQKETQASKESKVTLSP